MQFTVISQHSYSINQGENTKNLSEDSSYESGYWKSGVTAELRCSVPSYSWRQMIFCSFHDEIMKSVLFQFLEKIVNLQFILRIAALTTRTRALTHARTHTHTRNLLSFLGPTN
jgi:hypothetical protein